MAIPIRIRYPFTSSEALDRHIERCLGSGLRSAAVTRRLPRRTEAGR